MRILKTEQYINEKLAIQPVTKDRLSKIMKEGPSVDENTRKFIKDNNLIWNLKTMSYDCDGDVKVSEDIVAGGKLKIRFGNIGGNFDCGNNSLTTLEGAPQEVGGYFGCYDNNLTTLEGAPQKVGGHFSCSHNNLTTLEGAPQEVGGSFSCSSNKLTALEGAPQEVGGMFDCSSNNLTTLEGAPQKVGGDFICTGNTNLVLPKEIPSWVKGRIIR